MVVFVMVRLTNTARTDTHTHKYHANIQLIQLTKLYGGIEINIINVLCTYYELFAVDLYYFSCQFRVGGKQIKRTILL